MGARWGLDGGSCPVGSGAWRSAVGDGVATLPKSSKQPPRDPAPLAGRAIEWTSLSTSRRRLHPTFVAAAKTQSSTQDAE